MKLHEPSLKERPELFFEKDPIKKKGFKGQVKSESDNSPKRDSILTVAIVAYNEQTELLSLIETVLASSKGHKAKLLLIDNGLSAEIKRKVKAYPLHYIEATENLGCCGGRNLAAAYTDTELIAFVDADGAVNENYVKQCLAAMKDPALVTARGKVLPLHSSSYSISSYDMGDKVFACPPIAEGISVWRTAVFKKAGGFEASLYGGEGIVLCHRLIEIFGYARENFIYFPKLVLYHNFGKDVSHLASKLVRNFINRWHVDRKYPLLERMLRDFRKGYIDIVPKPVPQPKDFVNISQEASKDFNRQLETLKSEITNRRLSHPDEPKADGSYNFTVVIPCYNLGAYVRKALHSVAAQSLDHIEIIIVDDVSTDPATRMELRDLEKHVKVVYRKKNGGASAARNTGIKLAKSPYILCLDADDTIEHTYLEEAFNVFQQNARAGIVCSHMKQTGERTIPWYPEDNVTINANALISSPVPSASCFRREAWQQTGGYDENMRGAEDWEFWISILEKGWTQRSITRFHFIYLNRPNSKVKTSDKNTYSIVSYIVQKHRQAYIDNIVEVIATDIQTRKRFRNSLYETQQILSTATRKLAAVEQSQSILFRRGLLSRKLKSAAKTLLVERNISLLLKLTANNLSSLRSRLR